MAKILWDQPGERVYQTGLDRGVLYLSTEGPSISGYDNGVAWNGLVSVNDAAENMAYEQVHFDGRKILGKISPGDYSATIKALTYPNEFEEFAGYLEFASGILLDNQYHKQFGLSYRTLVGNDISGKDLGYRIHLLYNLTAMPDATAYQTVDSNAAPISFSWKVNGTPENVEWVIGGTTGSLIPRRPTAHFIIDSRDVHPEVLAYIEDILYGTEGEVPRLITVTELLVDTSVIIEEFELFDGFYHEWTATGPSYLVSMVDADSFDVTGATIDVVDEFEYDISSSYA